MEPNKVALSFGALLHDIGKVVYRGFSGQGTHSQLGARFIAEDVAALNPCFEGEAGKAIVEQIRFHHAGEMAAASRSQLPDDSLAYITYFADNISAGMDRRNEGEDGQGRYFDRNAKLAKIFNILNGHRDDNTLEHEDYNATRERIKQGLAGICIDEAEINSLLNLLEATTGTIPSSTDTSQIADISLYDHAKTTAGIAACLYDCLHERGIRDYRSVLFKKGTADGVYAEPLFLLYSCDMSGIQSFIYNISGSGALKQLRARSMYLELLLEHCIDELLEMLDLSRANVLYAGGGHAYMLLPNTNKVKQSLEEFMREIKAWFLRRHKTDLFIASAWVECSADDLMNKGEDKTRYPLLYRRLSERLSAVKSARYTADEIRSLNFGGAKGDHARECSECHRSDSALDGSGKCSLCSSLGGISRDLAGKDVFVVRRLAAGDGEGDSAAFGKELALPFGCRLSMYRREEYLKQRPEAVRVYTKNTWDMGVSLATHIWMGDYTADFGFEGISSYAASGGTLEEGKGITRLAALRADVDDLGAAFVSGLPPELASISRTSTFSRALSFFFKKRINEILSEKGYRLQVIYSGGDDLFIVGNWSDVIHAAVDIRQELRAYTGNDSLTISAGIGMFFDTYPIAAIAEETGRLEDAAKSFVRLGQDAASKNAVALWSDQRVFAWEDFIEVVVPLRDEVAHLLRKNEKGKAFIYKLVALLRESSSDPIAAPRMAYLLARSFDSEDDEGRKACARFFEMTSKESSRLQLLTALEWYVYETREGN